MTSNAVKKYFKSTTLHGFKYLMSKYYTDRIFWVVSCCASTCCAGMLCSALWERFLHLPALLVLQDSPNEFNNFQPIPTVAVCQPIYASARNFLTAYAPERMNIRRLAGTFSRALRGQPANVTEVNFVEQLIRVNHFNLVQLLLAFTPTCTSLIARCRWQNFPVLPEHIFEKKITHGGVCCVIDPERLSNVQVPTLLSLGPTKKLDMVLDCSNGTISLGCTFYTQYGGEDFIVPKHLAPGNSYFGELSFTHEKDKDDQNLVSNSCVSTDGHSQQECLKQVRPPVQAHILHQFFVSVTTSRMLEVLTSGDSKPQELLAPITPKDRSRPLVGPEKGLNSTCECLPPCNKVITRLILEPSRIVSNVTLDPLYSELNASQTVVMRLRIDITHSKIFRLIPTETWLTLLSSLGGVFNMFLGVGLFSALELLFFFFVKLPESLRRI